MHFHFPNFHQYAYIYTCSQTHDIFIYKYSTKINRKVALYRSLPFFFYGEGHKGKAKARNKTDEKGLRDWSFHPEVKMER